MGVICMGDIQDSSYTWPVLPENVTGIGVAGPPADETAAPEEETHNESTVQTENNKFSEEDVGNNIDVEA